MPAPCRRGEYPTISTTGDPAVSNSRDSRSHRNPSPRGSRFANERDQPGLIDDYFPLVNAHR